MTCYLLVKIVMQVSPTISTDRRKKILEAELMEGSEGVEETYEESCEIWRRRRVKTKGKEALGEKKIAGG